MRCSFTFWGYASVHADVLDQMRLASCGIKPTVIAEPGAAELDEFSTVDRPIVSVTKNMSEAIEMTSMQEGWQTAGSKDGTPQAPFSPSGGGTVAGSGGSAVATASMTNILALDGEGQVVAILMINTMPSWMRPDEGKVEIHNRRNPALFTN